MSLSRCDVCQVRTAFPQRWEGADGSMMLCRRCHRRVTGVMARYAEFMLDMVDGAPPRPTLRGYLRAIPYLLGVAILLLVLPPLVLYREIADRSTRRGGLPGPLPAPHEPILGGYHRYKTRRMADSPSLP
ncbi:MAG: hypothetical protein HY558_06450 [Euryarchaeota archaeon]|nr:hypothetical protein [Euryarchaeota archaeon]